MRVVPLGVVLIIATFVVVAGSTIWVGRDYLAMARSYGKDPDADLVTAWIIGCFVMWIIFFPLYLSTRPKRRRAFRTPV